MASPIPPALQVLSATPGTLAHLVAEADDARLDTAPAAGEWAPRTLLAHFRDDEFLCMRVALERMLAENDPELHFVDGADWEPGRNRGRERKDHLLADFALQRQASLAILRNLRDEDWARVGHSADGRAFSVAQFVNSWGEHDREHIAQLEAALGEDLETVLRRRSHPE